MYIARNSRYSFILCLLGIGAVGLTTAQAQSGGARAAAKNGVPVYQTRSK